SAQQNKVQPNTYRRATDADPSDAQAWINLGFRLGQQADEEGAPTAERRKLRQEEIQAYRRATDADPARAQAWTNLGFCLGQQADEEDAPAKKRKLRQEQIQAYRHATDADPAYARAWNLLSAAQVKAARESRKAELLKQAIESASKAASLGSSRYNLSCALAVAGKFDEALSELGGCLDRGEIKKSFVESDPDWEALTEDSGFEEVLRKFG
ncbi:MAG: hypothetical protein V3T83_19145, partial [Acidobacteriota bacterium]